MLPGCLPRRLLPSVLALTLSCGLIAVGAQSPQPPTSPQSPQPPATPPPPGDQPQQRPTFRAGANLVRVDVTVIDHHGEPVDDLQKDDFDVTEDGVHQPVETFKFIEANGQPAPDDDLSLPIRSPEHAAAEAARDDVRVFIIFWDEYHIGQMQPAFAGRQALTQFARTAFAPTDLVALMDPLTPLDAIRFTRDWNALADQIHNLKGRLGLYIPPRSPMEEAHLYGGRDVEMLRAQITASAMEGAVLFLRSIKEGRKSIVFVSQDIGPIGGRGPSGMSERYHWLDKIVRLANDGNTAIYTMDPRGFNGNMSDILKALAEDTGGRAVQSNAPAVALRQVVKDASAFYLLGYPSPAPADGKFHKIKVKVKRNGVDVRARSGYLAPSLTEIEAAAKAAKVAEVPTEVTHALTPLDVRPESTGELWIGSARGPDGRPRVTVSWLPRPGEQNQSARTPPRVTITASGADGQVYFDGPLDGNVVSFAAPAGALTIRRTILDPDGSAGDRQDLPMTVPDFDTAGLVIATPVVSRARTGVELNALRAAKDLTPYAGHEFDRTDRILVRFGVYGQAASGAAVTANLLSKRGDRLSALQFRERPGDAGSYEIELPLGSVAKGDYLIAIEAAHGDQHARTLVPFRAQ